MELGVIGWSARADGTVQAGRFSEWLGHTAGTAIMQREQFAASSCKESTCIGYQLFSLSALSDGKGAYNGSDQRVLQKQHLGTP